MQAVRDISLKREPCESPEMAPLLARPMQTSTFILLLAYPYSVGQLAPITGLIL
jgi:hypothetical protein